MNNWKNSKSEDDEHTINLITSPCKGSHYQNARPFLNNKQLILNSEKKNNEATSAAN